MHHRVAMQELMIEWKKQNEINLALAHNFQHYQVRSQHEDGKHSIIKSLTLSYLGKYVFIPLKQSAINCLAGTCA